MKRAFRVLCCVVLCIVFLLSPVGPAPGRALEVSSRNAVSAPARAFSTQSSQGQPTPSQLADRVIRVSKVPVAISVSDQDGTGFQVLPFDYYTQQADGPATEASDPLDSAAFQAAWTALESYLTAHSIRLEGRLLRCEVLDDWAYATALYADEDTGAPVSAEPFLLLVRKMPGCNWRAVLPVPEDAVDYAAWLDSVPEELVPLASVIRANL